MSNGVIVVSGLLGGVLAARFLGAEDRGLLAAIIYWPHFIAGIAAIGLNEGIVIHTARFGSTVTLRSTTFALSLGLALPVGIIGFILMPLLLGESRQGYLLFSQLYLLAFLPITYLAQNFLAIDQGELNFSRFNIQRIIQATAYPLLLLILWLTGTLTVEHAAIAVLSGTAIVAFLRVWYARSSLAVGPSPQEAIQLLALSFRLHLANVVMALSMQVDKMVLVLFSNNTELGLYVVATTAAGVVVSLFVRTYINIMLPTAAQTRSGRGNISEIIVSLRRLLGIITLSTALLVLIMPYLITLVFGIDFEAAGDYARILLLAFAFVGIKKALVYLLRSWGQNRPAIIGESLTSVILILGAYLSVQWWGTIGLCVLVVLAHAAGAVLVSYYFFNKAGLTLRQFVGFDTIVAQ